MRISVAKDIDDKWAAIDVNSPNSVQIHIDYNGKTVWVNVEDRMMFRASMIDVLEIQDDRVEGTDDASR